ncbi:MAG: efflux RND transporter permease subunit [Hymenobacter sp.]
MAVLNGIVLIGYFNQLKAEGIRDLRGAHPARHRSAPAARADDGHRGFAGLSADGPGAPPPGPRCRRPLATVVIGGLVSATLLTLLVLPVLYYLFAKVLSLTRKAGRGR